MGIQKWRGTHGSPIVLWDEVVIVTSDVEMVVRASHLQKKFTWINRGQGSNRKWEEFLSKMEATGTSLEVQWLRLHAPKAGGPGSIPAKETRSHML